MGGDCEEEKISENFIVEEGCAVRQKSLMARWWGWINASSVRCVLTIICGTVIDVVLMLELVSPSDHAFSLPSPPPVNIFLANYLIFFYFFIILLLLNYNSSSCSFSYFPDLLGLGFWWHLATGCVDRIEHSGL